MFFKNSDFNHKMLTRTKPAENIHFIEQKLICRVSSDCACECTLYYVPHLNPQPISNRKDMIVDLSFDGAPKAHDKTTTQACASPTPSLNLLREDIKQNPEKYNFLKVLDEQDCEIFLTQLSEKEMQEIYLHQAIRLHMFIGVLNRCKKELNSRYCFVRKGYFGEMTDQLLIFPPIKSQNCYVQITKITNWSHPHFEFSFKSLIYGKPAYPTKNILVNNNEMTVVKIKPNAIPYALFDLPNEFYV